MKWTQIRNRWKLLSSHLFGRGDVGAHPITLIVENTSRCNLKCPMCAREFGYLPPEDLDLNPFKRIICGVDRRYLLGRGGESQLVRSRSEPPDDRLGK